MRRPYVRLSSSNENLGNERSRLPLRIVRVRLQLFPPGEIIVPSHRAAVIGFRQACLRGLSFAASGGEIFQKVANLSYVTQLVILLLPEWGAWRRLTQCPVIVCITVCQVLFLLIQCMIIGP